MQTFGATEKICGMTGAKCGTIAAICDGLTGTGCRTAATWLATAAMATSRTPARTRATYDMIAAKLALTAATFAMTGVTSVMTVVRSVMTAAADNLCSSELGAEGNHPRLLLCCFVILVSAYAAPLGRVRPGAIRWEPGKCPDTGGPSGTGPARRFRKREGLCGSGPR